MVMVKTSWPFIEWIETVNNQGARKLEVREEIVIGDDVIGNMGVITKVELFSCGLKPFSLSISADNVLGITAENRRGEYFYYALFENVHVGERKKLKVLIKGEDTFKTLKEDGYYSNFAWNTPHTQRLVFPKGWKILSAAPKGYRLETYKGKPSIVWRRSGRFWGKVQVKLRRSRA
jgi:hypothetical protein